MTEETVSAQAREAAAEWCAAQPFPSKQAEAPLIRRGEYDHHSLVQAFARFECTITSASPAGLEKIVTDALSAIEITPEPYRAARAILALGEIRAALSTPSPDGSKDNE